LFGVKIHAPQHVRRGLLLPEQVPQHRLRRLVFRVRAEIWLCTKQRLVCQNKRGPSEKPRLPASKSNWALRPA
jgi:hypothetical protein